MKKELTQSRLKEVLNYDPETGVFTRVISTSPTARKGVVAGGVDGHGYWSIHLDGRTYRAHRLAWFWTFGRWPKNQLDHQDGDRLNNRVGNLREATDSENRQNMHKKKGTRSKLAGVTWFPRDSRWMSRLGVNYQSIFLGYFDTEDEAHQAYLAAKAVHHTFQPVPREVAA